MKTYIGNTDKKNVKGIMISVVFAIVLCFIALAVSMLARATAETTDFEGYEIYPVPHGIEYGDGFVRIPHEGSVRFGDGIDDATIDHAYATLALVDMLAYDDTDKNFEIYVGIAGSGDAADEYITNSGITVSAGLFDKNDAYMLVIDDDRIIVLGKDTDSAYYGITTLAAILEQSGNTVRKLIVEDYSDSVFRGFIEGYYGIPWTSEERIELMRFGSKFKTNIYIYAPKDDDYHSANWRGLYSPADLAELKEQIEAGRSTKTRFAWALHPFLHSQFTQANFVRDLNTVLAKFEQLYKAGVRQFVISADDVDTSGGNRIDGALHRDLLNNVSEWVKGKGDCYDLIFVPSAYCYQSNGVLGVDLDYYYRMLTTGLDPSVYIMWTGNGVCSSVSTGRFDEFTELSGRKAFMWLNWPVNDYAQSYLLMGKGEVLDVKLQDGQDPDFYGIVTNPMQLAEASKLSIFAVADYCWNINGFAVDKSYADSFKYIEQNKPEELATLCEHLANATLYEGRYFEESESIKPYINAFLGACADGEDITDCVTPLKARFDAIVSAADGYLSGAVNLKLKDSIEPWVTSLKLLSEQCSLALELITDIDDMTDEVAEQKYDEMRAKDELRENCKSPILNVITYNRDGMTVSVAPATLAPFSAKVVAMAVDKASMKLGLPTGNTYSGFAGIYEGVMSYITDGDDDTLVWFDGTPPEGAYIRVDLGELTVINDISVLTGLLTGGDSMTGYIEYSVDGTAYTRAGEMTGAETTVDLRDTPVSARFIRLVNSGTPTWIAVREVRINVLDPLEPVVTFGNIILEPSVTTSVKNMIDGDPDTYTWFSYNDTPGAFILLDVREAKTISSVTVLMAKSDSPSDYFPSIEISYSVDGENFTAIGEYSGKEITANLDVPVSARYIMIIALETSHTGIVVREFSVE